MNECTEAVDCTRVDNPTCPKCGATWEDDDGACDGGWVGECDECGTVYEVEAEYTVDYSSSELTPVQYDDQDGNAAQGFCQMKSIWYCGAQFMPPDGRARQIYNRNGYEVAFVQADTISPIDSKLIVSVCPTCGGSGIAKTHGESRICPRCHGTGSVK